MLYKKCKYSIQSLLVIDRGQGVFVCVCVLFFKLTSVFKTLFSWQSVVHVFKVACSVVLNIP